MKPTDIPTPDPGFEIVTFVKIPMEMGAFAQWLKLAVKAFGKDARLIGTGGRYAFVQAKIQPVEPIKPGINPD